MNEAGHFHTISRSPRGNLTIFRVGHGRTFAAEVPTTFRFFRNRRIRDRLAKAFRTNRVEFLTIEGDVRFDVELLKAIVAAGRATGAKVLP